MTVKLYMCMNIFRLGRYSLMLTYFLESPYVLIHVIAIVYAYVSP